MFGKKPLLVKDLPLNEIKAILECYQSLNEETEVVVALNEIAIEYSSMADKVVELKEDKEKFESALSDKYIKLERNLNNDLAEKESAMIKSFNLREEESKEKIFVLNTKIAHLKLDFELVQKENTILVAKMDDQDELRDEISNLESLVAALTAENNEKDSKFNLLLDIYNNPKVQEVKIVNPTIVEPRIIPTVSCNQK